MYLRTPEAYFLLSIWSATRARTGSKSMFCFLRLYLAEYLNFIMCCLFPLFCVNEKCFLNLQKMVHVSWDSLQCCSTPSINRDYDLSTCHRTRSGNFVAPLRKMIWTLHKVMSRALWVSYTVRCPLVSYLVETVLFFCGLSTSSHCFFM